MLEISNLSFGYGSQPILRNINLAFRQGKMTAVIGPNATGKSTLLKCIRIDNQFGFASRAGNAGANKKLTITRNMTTVVTLYQLDMAARFADEIVVLSGGEVYATGQPAAVLTTDMLRTMYQVNAAIHQASDGVLHVRVMSSIK